MKSILTSLLISASTISFAQIKGGVLDAETEKPIPYVNIWVENEAIGTTSNYEGQFSLKGINTSASLVFSAVGYHRQTANLIGQNPVVYLKKTSS